MMSTEREVSTKSAFPTSFDLSTFSRELCECHKWS